jgi:nucleoid DNA-binding protein
LPITSEKPSQMKDAGKDAKHDQGLVGKQVIKPHVLKPISVFDDLPDAQAAVKPTVVAPLPKAVVMGAVMRKRELLDTVVTQSGLKKKDVKPVVDMVLEVLGQALAENREMNLQPFGRLMVRKERSLTNGRMVIAKIRQAEPDNRYE